jgi:hypothetical protein
VFCDGYSSGPLSSTVTRNYVQGRIDQTQCFLVVGVELSFTVTSTNFRIEVEPTDVIKLDLYVGLFPAISNEHLVDSVCGAPMVLESTKFLPCMIGQFWSVHGDTECFVLPMDALIRDRLEVDT